MSETIILMSTSAAVFVAVACIASLSADLIYRDDSLIDERLQREFQSSEKQNPQKSPLFRDLTMFESQAVGRNLLRTWWGNYVIHVEQSGLQLAPMHVVLIALACGSISGASIHFAIGRPVVSAVVLLVGLAGPFLLIEYRWHRCRRILCEQLPDAFDQIKRSIRAGLPLIKAMQQIAIDFPPPISHEFEVCCQKQELGLSQSIAMLELARRINVIEVQMFVVTVLIQRDIGGNTAEILGKLSNVVRQRHRLANRIKALTAEGRLQALVLAALPLLAGGFMMTANPEYMSVLLEQPKLIAGLVVSELIGVIWIRKITAIDF